ncbi:MAG: hypothetical protein ABIA75_00710 [Candidatus Neomarinimicrobiota bacterium]
MGKLTAKIMLTVLLSVTLSRGHVYRGDDHFLNDLDLDWQKGSLIITEKENDDQRVVMTADEKLLINGENVRLTREQKKLVGEFHILAGKLSDQARDIGQIGSKIGVVAGAMAAEAIVKAFGSLFDDDDDFDDRDHRHESRVERKVDLMTEDIEDLVSELENTINNMEQVYDQLKRDIPELRDLSWF